MLPQPLQQLPTPLGLPLTAMHQLRSQHWRKPHHKTLQVHGIQDALLLELLQSFDGQVRDEATVRWERR